ncbi:hypothetical protein, partial [Methylosinus sp. R-45379]|uniref:hypothetical protein n=1 Tax=Methylosinus sp. R-45379 TaxID=980563 RepID=UPI001AECC02A
ARVPTARRRARRFLTVICGRPSLASTFDVSNDLIGCGHMSGLLVRRICPLALMKSDDRDPYQSGELCAHDGERVVPGFGCDRVVHHASLRLPNSNL